jgi:sugar porter (SP) family MFS transporter
MHAKSTLKFFIIVSTAVAALGGLLFGFDTGVISGAILFISKQFHLTAWSNGLVVSAVLLGALMGAILSGRVSDYFGRRRLLLGLGVVFILGTLLTAVAPDLVILVIGRIIVGVAIGISSFTVPLYLAELAPSQYRGAMVSVNQLAITIGILVSYFVDLTFASTGNWRSMLAMGIIPAVGLLIGMIFLPESPRWLMLKGLRAQAEDVLKRTRRHQDIQQELNEIQQALKQEKGGWRLLLQPWIRPAVIIGFGMAFLQQATGINTIIYYAPTILQLAGFHQATGAILATIGVGVVNVMATIIALPFLDTLGRRPLTLIGLTGMTLGLGALSFAFHHADSMGMLKWLALASMILYIACFAFSLGVMAWLIIAEIFPLRVRGLATSLAVAATWGINMIIAFTFMTLIQQFGASYTFLIYCVVCIAGWFFVYFNVPETKGVSLEQIEMNLLSGKKFKDLR